MDSRKHLPNVSIYKFSIMRGLIMAALYLAVGIILLSTDIFDSIKPEIRLLLGILIVAYGIFRSIRFIRQIKFKKSENNENE